MADATVRVSGTVLHVDTRRGVSQRTQEPYAITTARVLVAETGIADVTLPDSITVGRGQDVDLLADVSVYSGRAQLRAISELAA